MRKLVLTFSILIAAAFILFWFVKDPTADFVASVPGMDSNSAYIANAQEVKIGEFFKQGTLKENNYQETWSRFRGDDYSNISISEIPLISRFPSDGPKVMWSMELGEGHGGAAIYKGMVYILDYDEEDRADVLKCLDLETGVEIWRRWYKVSIKRNHGISRTVPAVTEDYILSMGPKCHIMCLKRETGELLWSMDLNKEYGSEVPLWYTGQCPLIDNGIAVIAAGGSDLLVGIDCATGEKLWQTPNSDSWKMSHSSILPFVFNGKKMYVYAAIGGICGVSAQGDDRGKILWKSADFVPNVVAPTPLCMPDGKIFQTAGYGAGSAVFQLKMEGNGIGVETLQVYKPREGMASEQQTPILFKGYLLGIQPKDAGASRNQLISVKPDDCTQIVMRSGKAKRFGLGPYMIADGKLFLLDDDGTLYILEANTNKYIELDSYQVLDGVDAWAPLAIADGFMVLRDSKKMICIDMSLTRNS
jgi:outer membrane protein assembly factor BamB